MLSKKVQSVPKALSIYLNELVYELKNRGLDIITLSLGEAFFDLPYFGFNEDKIEKGYHYSESNGRRKLRECIASYYSLNYGAGDISLNQILISAGSKPIIYMAMLTVCDEGDEILILEPGWLSYAEQAKFAGLQTRYVPYDCDINDVKNYLTEKTRLLIINNPNNPAGRHYTVDELEILYSDCLNNDTTLLVDEAYSDFTPRPFTSAISLDQGAGYLIVVNSISKNLGMSGWRIGYAISNSNYIEHLQKANQHLITCGATLLNDYVADNFDGLVLAVKPQIDSLLLKRREVVQIIKRLGMSCLDGDSTFYIFLSLNGYVGSVYDLCIDLLINERISVVPGSAYGDTTSDFVRISIGTETIERIEKALVKISAKICQPNIGLKKLNTLLRDLDLPLNEMEL